MRESFGKLFQTKFKNPIAQTRIRKMKHLVFLFFAVGFFCFLIFGARFMEDVTLLETSSLKRLRDVGIEPKAFLEYLCVSHAVLFFLFAFCWWYQRGKVCTLAWISFGALKLGMCLAVSLIRYQLKGIWLWVLLYLPHTFFYVLALLCGMMLCQTRLSTRTEKVRFLLQNSLWILGILVSWGLGLYVECYVSSDLLRNYLKHF